MTRRWMATVAAAVAIALGTFLFAAWFAAFDDGGIRRGDLAYFVFIPSRVRALPTPAACDEPVFASRTNDSLEAEVVSMEYRSRAEPGALRESYARELQPLACESGWAAAADTAITYHCTEPELDVTLRAGEADAATGCRPVVLEFRY